MEEFKNTKLICSLATWRSLRKENRTQYDVIEAFCLDIINRKGFDTKEFKTEEIQTEIKNLYGLNIPLSILEQALSKNTHIKRKDGLYFIQQTIEDDNHIDESIKKYTREYKDFINDLSLFVKNKFNNKNNINIENLLNEFILNEDKIDKTKPQEIFAYFTDFLLHNKDRYEKLLQVIREGVILYEGLTYDIQRQKNKNKIILFLDTEILFSAMGYNGQIYKAKFDDFYELVSKYDENRPFMPLYYNEIIKEEIKSFFYSAKKIKEQKKGDYKRTAAMVYLMEKCKDETEIETEESRFFYELNKQFKITKFKDSYDELLEKHPDYNLENIHSLDNIKANLKSNYKEVDNDKFEENINNSIKILSFTSMVRKNNPKKFFASPTFLITDTKLTNTIAWNENIMEDKTIPLSTNLNFITARLWEFLEISLGKRIELKTQNPIFHIQVLLKEMLSNELGRQYEKAKKDYENDPNNERFAQEIMDIHDKMKLEPNIDTIESFEHILSNDILEEQKKLAYIEQDKKYNQGKEEGIKEGIAKAQRDRQREEKKNKRNVRLLKYTFSIKNLKRISQKIILFTKKYIWWLMMTIILGVVASIVASFIYDYLKTKG